MQQSTKGQIKEALKGYIKRYDSQNAAANSLTGISPATISNILSEKWDAIADPMWRKLAKQIGFNTNALNTAKTSVVKKISAYLSDSQRNPDGIRAIIANASMGKDTTVADWCLNNSNSYAIHCHRQMSVRILVRDILKSMGKESSGTLSEMMEKLIEHIERDNEPLIIFNEADKLRDEVLEMFIDLENKLHNKAGMVFLATPYMEKRIRLGVARGKRGFAELFSRMKKMFFDVTPEYDEFVADVTAICTANGIVNNAVIKDMVKNCDRDFRVLCDLIRAFKNL